MTQPPNTPGPSTPGWQQPPAAYPPQPGYGSGQPGYGQGGPGGPAYGPGSGGPSGPGYGPGGPGYGPGGPAYGPGGPGYGPGGPGGPRRGRTVLSVVLAAFAVLVLVGVGALVVPGLVGGDKESGPTAPSVSSSPPAGSQPSTTSPVTPPMTPPATPPAGARRLTEASALVTKFLTFLNANDQKHAAALGCTETQKLLPAVILLAVDPPTKLTVNGPAVALGKPGGDPYYEKLLSVPFAGTTKHNPATGTVTVMDVPARPLCIRLMTLKLG
ncbi:hypothetical protein AB0E69_32240 [Kribbella sp. NPDC026611]|uniref:hypothetical protein n=1 Tax=Kribbella sp. NPDC026611 TaxID=3154911 RepID=UPI00340DC4CC